jgi:hypothetical protein
MTCSRLHALSSVPANGKQGIESCVRALCQRLARADHESVSRLHTRIWLHICARWSRIGIKPFIRTWQVIVQYVISRHGDTMRNVAVLRFVQSSKLPAEQHGGACRATQAHTFEVESILNIKRRYTCTCCHRHCSCALSSSRMPFGFLASTTLLARAIQRSLSFTFVKLRANAILRATCQSLRAGERLAAGK